MKIIQKIIGRIIHFHRFLQANRGSPCFVAKCSIPYHRVQKKYTCSNAQARGQRQRNKICFDAKKMWTKSIANSFVLTMHPSVGIMQHVSHVLANSPMLTHSLRFFIPFHGYWWGEKKMRSIIKNEIKIFHLFRLHLTNAAQWPLPCNEHKHWLSTVNCILLMDVNVSIALSSKPILVMFSMLFLAAVFLYFSLVPCRSLAFLFIFIIIY